MLYVISACFSLLINVDGVGSVGARVRGWRKSNLGVDAVGAVSPKNFGVGDVGRNFGVDCVGLGCFVKKVLSKILQNFQENTCPRVSC